MPCLWKASSGKQHLEDVQHLTEALGERSRDKPPTPSYRATAGDSRNSLKRGANFGSRTKLRRASVAHFDFRIASRTIQSGVVATALQNIEDVARTSVRDSAGWHNPIDRGMRHAP
jgi:hypothetical protein